MITLVLLGDTGIHRSAMIADRKKPVVETFSRKVSSMRLRVEDSDNTN